MKVYSTAILLTTLLTLSSAQQRQAPSFPHGYIQQHNPETQTPTEDVTIHYISQFNPFFPQQRNTHSWKVKMRPLASTAGDYMGFAFLEQETSFRRAWVASGPDDVECYIGGLKSPDGSNTFNAERPFRGNVKSRMLKCELKGKGLRRVEEVRDDGYDDERWILRGDGVGDGSDRRLLRPHGERKLLEGTTRGDLPEALPQDSRRKSRWW